MDIVLGVSMAPTTVRMVLVEGQSADGSTVDEDGFDVTAAEDSPTAGAPERVIAAILGTRESAAEGDYHLAATGVTWTDPVEAAALRDALAAHKVENVMLVSAFLAAAALAQSVGSAVGYAHTGLLFLEPDTATLAIVDSADGSIVDVRRRPVHGTDPLTELTDLVTQLDAMQSPPDGVFVVGAGVDITRIKPRLEAATPLPVTVPEEPDTALARGAALASANAPLFVSSTAAVAYSQVPDWTMAGVVDPYATEAAPVDALAYSGETEDDAYTAVGADFHADQQGRKPLLVALSVMTIFFVGVSALVISLGIRARPALSQQPRAGTNLIFPVKEAPAPPPKAEVQAPPAAPPNVGQQPAPQAQQTPANAVAPAPAPEAAAPVPVPAAPAPEAAVPAPMPAAPKPIPVPVAATPAPAAPAPQPAAPAPAPVAPAPAPAAPAPAPVQVAPVPVPVPVAPVIPILPPVLNPPAHGSPLQPGGGDRDRGGWLPGGGGRDRGGWPPGGGWQPGGGDRGGGGWLPGSGPGGGGIGGNHGGFGGPGGFGGGRGGGIGGGFGGGHGGFGGGHGGR